MFILEKKLSEITEEDLIRLIEDKVPEGRFIDYKKDLPKSNHESKKEFLADVVSFANSGGGEIIYGIDEDKGFPSELCGLQIADQDQEILRLENLLRDGVEPRIPRVDFQAIPLSEGKGFALAVRIPKSWNSPHMVTLEYKDHERFFGRDSRGKYAFDYQQIREAFNLHGSNLERLRAFRFSRLDRIKGDYPMPLLNNPKVVAHLVPLTMLDPSWIIDVKEIEDKVTSLEIFGATSYRFNLDGIIQFEDESESEGKHLVSSAYQLFRGGAVEFIDAFILKLVERNILPARSIEKELLGLLEQSTNLFKKANISPPSFFWLSLIGVRGYEVFSTHLDSGFGRPERQIDRDDLLFPEILIEDFKEEDIRKAVDQVMEMVWQSSGKTKPD